MDVVDNGNNMDSIITLQDFPFICRICCLKRSDLRLFEKESYLLDLFHSIRKIDVHSRAELPRNICSECINRLEELSVFIDISKHKDANLVKNMKPNEETSKKSEEDISLRKSQTCRICLSSASTLIPFTEKKHLMKLFENITNTDVQDESHSSRISSVCNKCINELERISSFVSSSIRNDRKLENAVGRNEIVKTENCSDSIDVDTSACQDLNFGNIVDMDEALTEYTSREMSFVHGNEDALKIIDVKEEVFDDEMSEQNNPNELEEKAFHGSLLKEMLLQNIDDEKNQTSGKKSFECDHCNKSFVSEQNLRRHKLIHTGEKAFGCEICERRFTEKRYLQQHMHTHSEEKPFRCDCCEKSFNEKRNLERHKFNKHGKKQFTCKSCNKSFYLRRNLKQHMLTDHGGKPYKCESCASTFKRNAHLKQHLITHSGEKPFKCDSCSKSFTQKGTLQQHMLTHAREKPFKCGCCEKKFTTETTLRNHLLTLAGQKPFQCEHCKNRFAQKCDLKHHMLTHTGCEPIESNWFEKRVARKTAFLNRMYTDTEERPFKCETCNKCFIQIGHLKQHSLTHSEMKPYKCDCCAKSFKRKDHLKQHMERSHSNVTAATEVSPGRVVLSSICSLSLEKNHSNVA